MKTEEVDNLITLVCQLFDAFGKSDFLPPIEQAQLMSFCGYESIRDHSKLLDRLGGGSRFDEKADKQRREAISYDENRSAALKRELRTKKEAYFRDYIKPLQEKLYLFLKPRLPELQYKIDRKVLDAMQGLFPDGITSTNYVRSHNEPVIVGHEKEKIISALEGFKAKLEYNKPAKSAETILPKQDDFVKLPDMSKKVYEILADLPPGQALLGRQIADEMQKRHGITTDENTLCKHHFPKLKPFGLKNTPRVGYYLDPHPKPAQ